MLKHQKLILSGTGNENIAFRYVNDRGDAIERMHPFEGVLNNLERRYREQTEDCQEGDQEACLKARETYDEIQELLPTIPVEPDR